MLAYCLVIAWENLELFPEGVSHDIDDEMRHVVRHLAQEVGFDFAEVYVRDDGELVPKQENPSRGGAEFAAALCRRLRGDRVPDQDLERRIAMFERAIEWGEANVPGLDSEPLKIALADHREMLAGIGAWEPSNAEELRQAAKDAVARLRREVH